MPFLITGSERWDVGGKHRGTNASCGRTQTLFFSNSSRTSAEDRMEIDFLIAKPVTTSRHNISPIEVKSGQRYTLNSLRKCMAKYGSQLSTPYVLHDKDVKTEDGIVCLPLFIYDTVALSDMGKQPAYQELLAAYNRLLMENELLHKEVDRLQS